MSTSASPKIPSAALVFLHGLGDTPAGWSEIEHVLPQLKPRLANLKYVFPAAPTIPISINGNMEMPGWFDLYDWPIAVGSRDDRDGLMQGVARIDDIVRTLKTEDGIEKDRVVVGGFSQGGAVALVSAYHEKSSGGNDDDDDDDKRYAGCACLSGWLTLKDEIKASSKTPLFWGHGRYDDKVLPEQQPFGIDVLKPMGVQVEASQYDMGHQSHPEEMVAFAEFLDKVLFEETSDK